MCDQFFFFFFLSTNTHTNRSTHTVHARRVPTLFRGRRHYLLLETAAEQSGGSPWHGCGRRRASSRTCERSRGRGWPRDVALVAEPVVDDGPA